MANGKEPKTTGEHIIALYGHITGIKREINDLHKRHDDNEKKQNHIMWALLGGMGSIIVILLSVTDIFK